MKVRARIFQIIKWEDKSNYFTATDFGTKPRDLLHLTLEKPKEHRWFVNTGYLYFYEMIKQKLKLPVKKRYDYNNFIFHSTCSEKGNDYMIDGLPVLVDSPNKYKENDIVEINVVIKKVKQ